MKDVTDTQAHIRRALRLYEMFVEIIEYWPWSHQSTQKGRHTLSTHRQFGVKVNPDSVIGNRCINK